MSETEHKAGYVALAGRPNAGKSTLMNALLETRLAIISDKPQTTRDRVTGMLNGEGFQAILVDSPGILSPRDPLQKVMMQTAEQVFRDSDVIVVICDVSRTQEFEPAMLRPHLDTKPSILLLNKIDRVSRPKLLPMIAKASELRDWREIIPISASRQDGVDRVTQAIVEALPAGPALFPEEELSEEPERFFVAEFVREQLMRLMGQELPYVVAVQVEEFTRREDGRRLISASIAVARESQKAMVIGKGGRMIKQVGTLARQAIQRFLDEPVHLDLRVRVEKNWNADPQQLGRLGYRPRG